MTKFVSHLITPVLLGRDPDMRRRIGLAMLGFVLYALNAGLSWWGIQTGYMRPELGQPLIAYLLIGPGLFYLAMRSGWSQRLQDPSMVLAQSLMCVGSVVLGFLAVQLQFRGLVLAILPLVLMFGQFTLRPRQIALICNAAIAALSLATAWRWMDTAETARHSIDLGQLVYIGGILLMTSRVAQIVSRMRYRLQVSRQELAEALAKVNELASRDALTGLTNRRRMQDLLSSEVQRPQATPQATRQTLSVALIDIDHFKRVNDTHGHAAGDEVLRRFAELAREALRDGDILARWGGEEFLLLCPHSTSEQAEVALSRLRRALQQASPLLPEIPSLEVTFSAGVALHRDAETIEATLERADQALYQAKAAGRNRTVHGDGPATPAPH